MIRRRFITILLFLPLIFVLSLWISSHLRHDHGSTTSMHNGYFLDSEDGTLRFRQYYYGLSGGPEDIARKSLPPVTDLAIPYGVLAGICALIPLRYVLLSKPAAVSEIHGPV